jgi:hypothetical protein
MFGLGKRIDWEARYAQLATTCADLKSDLDARDAWIAAMCEVLPLLKVRVDRCTDAYNRVTALIAEADEQGWIEK